MMTTQTIRKTNKKSIITARIETDINERYDLLAKKTDRTKSYFFRKVLENAIYELEESYIVDVVHNEIKNGTLETIPLEGVIDENGLRDIIYKESE